MKKQYIVPTVTVVWFDVQDIVTASDIIFGGSNDQPDGPTEAEAPYRNPIWDEEW